MNPQEWLQPPFDAKTQEEVRELMHDPEALADAFYTDLAFGTGGLRGLMGVGTNRMNIYTVRKATQGLSNYILEHGNPKAGVLIGFDSRHHSEEFALETARVLAGNQITAFLLKELRPTPFVSFACRAKHCQAAVMITASHNPKEYNGYKVYWSDGGQVVPPHDTGIMAEAVTDWNSIHVAPASSPLIHRIDGALDENYLRALHLLPHYPDDNYTHGSKLSIAYTSLHGTGITLMPRALESWGFKNIDFVEAQIFPNGDFPTVKSPNPESIDALKLGIETMVDEESDILLATDPDADRIGLVVRHEGRPVVMNGNQIAAICTEFICRASKKIPNGAFVTTIVTTELVKKIAEAHGYRCFEVLTGFKYIGEKIHEWEGKADAPQFLFGAEESYGYLIGTHARDKDAIAVGCLLAEIALHQKLQGKTIVDLLHEIYRQFGVYSERQLSLEFSPGKEGAAAISRLMRRLRTALPSTLGGQKVMAMDDLLSSLPKADVIRLRLSDGTRLVIRPSGTEPKLKIYAFTHEFTLKDLDQATKQCDSRLDTILKILKTELS